MSAVAFVNPLPINFVSGAAQGQFTAIHEVILFDSGGVGTQHIESSTNILATDSAAQIVVKIAAAVRSVVTSQFGVTIPSSAVVVPSITRA